jgi:hypothetical protein
MVSEVARLIGSRAFFKPIGNSMTQKTRHPEADHSPRPVIWSAPMWDLVAAMRLEAEILRRIPGQKQFADARDEEANRIVDVLIQAEGSVWVDTATAASLTKSKADTVRSWARRKRVRTIRKGGEWLYHRDDLFRLPGTAGSGEGSIEAED